MNTEKELKIKEVKVEVPDGYEIDKENSTFECIRFKQINKELPKTWEEYCRTHRRRKGEACFPYNGEVASIALTAGFKRHEIWDRSILPSKELGEAMLALCQLIQLRDCYNDGWVPDWTNIDDKYIIYIGNNIITLSTTCFIQHALAFKSKELRDEFFRNFRDLIEVAKPLL